MSMLSPWRQGFCGKMTGWFAGTLPVSGQRSGTGSETVLRSLLSHTVSTEGRAGSPRASDNAIDWGRSIENPKIICALQGGTPLPNREGHLRFPKGRLQGTEKEPEPLTRTFHQGESVYACQGGRPGLPLTGVCTIWGSTPAGITLRFPAGGFPCPAECLRR